MTMNDSYQPWTTDILRMLRHREERGARYAVSGHIRPGEYTYAYADTHQAAQQRAEQFRSRGCHQIQITPPEEEK